MFFLNTQILVLKVCVHAHMYVCVCAHVYVCMRVKSCSHKWRREVLRMGTNRKSGEKMAGVGGWEKTM